MYENTPTGTALTYEGILKSLVRGYTLEGFSIELAGGSKWRLLFSVFTFNLNAAEFGFRYYKVRPYTFELIAYKGNL